MRAQLDHCLLERPAEDASLEDISTLVKEKHDISNYTEHVTLFF